MYIIKNQLQNKTKNMAKFSYVTIYFCDKMVNLKVFFTI